MSPKVFIGINNSQEMVPAAFFWSMTKMHKQYEHVIERFDHSDCFIRNNRMIEAFLKSDCDIMAKMDIDQVYPENYLDELVPLVAEYKVVGPLIHNKWRNNGYFPLMHTTDDFPYVSEPIRLFAGIMEIPYAHSNLFFAREVLESIPAPWYEGHFNKRGTGRTKDVDFTFIDKVKDAGYSVFINTNVEAKHLVLEYIDTQMHRRWNGYGRI